MSMLLEKKQQTEQAKLQVEQNRLDLIRDAKISATAQVSLEPAEQSAGGFDISGNLRLVPKFSERDPEAFFAMFERVNIRKWPDLSAHIDAAVRLNRQGARGFFGYECG